MEVREKEGLRDRKSAEKVLKEKLRRPRWGIWNTMSTPGEMGPLGAEMRGKDNSQLGGCVGTEAPSGQRVPKESNGEHGINQSTLVLQGRPGRRLRTLKSLGKVAESTAHRETAVGSRTRDEMMPRMRRNNKHESRKPRSFRNHRVSNTTKPKEELREAIMER